MLTSYHSCWGLPPSQPTDSTGRTSAEVWVLLNLVPQGIPGGTLYDFPKLKIQCQPVTRSVLPQPEPCYGKVFSELLPAVRS